MKMSTSFEALLYVLLCTFSIYLHACYTAFCCRSI
uniref:Uncharacterized protein n=1 Tax=Arundo donax TaxID=35708 RepID=A0A0A8XRK2_ARUDO